MPIVNITTWPTPIEKKHKLIKEITRVVRDITGAPLNKITVYVQEINPDNWADGGVIGTDPSFREKTQQ